MEIEYNRKRINPPFWQHDYHVLRRIYKILSEIIKLYIANKKGKKILLDYGCGSAPYKELFSKYISKYITADIGENPSADILLQENDKIPLKSESIDIVLSTQVLEHVANQDIYLRECERLLKKGGLLILSTHGIWPYHPFPADYRRWTKQGLRYEIERFRFRVCNFYQILGEEAAMTEFMLLLFFKKIHGKFLFSDILLKIISIVGNIIILLEDKIFPSKFSNDCSVFVVCAEKI